jgi:predicted glycoside hydrolase/deacetylase ChbG (UPF0249 family)
LKQLIVNADDLGADEARNAGIFAAIESGIVTAASILVNGNAFEDCLRRISSINVRRFSWGVHLNLTEGKPLSAGLKIIIGMDGYFCGKQEGQRRLLERGDEALGTEIRREFAAQIQALRDADIPIDHLDGHQHVHIFPAAIDAALWAGEKFGIPWMRIPEEPLSLRKPRPGSQTIENEAQLFSALAAVARIGLSGAAMRTTDHFRGLYLKGRFSPVRCERTLQKLPHGLTELMVHPGRMPAGSAAKSPFSAFSNRDRQEELNVLMDDGFRLMLEKYHVRLTPFPEV